MGPGLRVLCATPAAQMGMVCAGVLTGEKRPRIVPVSFGSPFEMSSKLKTAFVMTCAALGVVSASVPADARPITPAERREQPYTGDLPGCQDAALLQRIASRFVQSEKQYWSSGLEILGYEKVRETGHRSNGLDYIPRRYCRATAVMNDGKARQVVYAIAEGQGIIGWGPGVEWCIVGLDRNYAWGRSCMAARP